MADLHRASPVSPPDPAQLRARNRRLALILASVAAVFFLGFMARMAVLHG